MKRRNILKSQAGLAVAISLAVSALSPASTAAATIAFYAPWDRPSDRSLARHAEQIDILAPAWITVTGPRDQVHVEDATDTPATLGALHRLHAILPLMQNVLDGVWHGADAAAMLASPDRRTALLNRLEAAVVARGGSGMIFDLEDLPPKAQASYISFLAEARGRFAGHHWKIGVCASADSSERDLSSYGQAADLVILMAYDEHWQTGAAGPIASPDWFSSAVKKAIGAMPPDRLVVGLASYGYDWPAGRPARPLSVSVARGLAQQMGAAVIRATPESQPHFTYAAKGVQHQVWFVDGQSNRAEADTARALGVKNLALWRLGTEDPALWDWFGKTAP